MRLACRLACVALGGGALLAPATAAAAPARDAGVRAQAWTKLRSISSPPATARPGDAFTLTARVRNVYHRSVRPRLTITLRKNRSDAGRKVRAKRLGRVAPGRTLRYRIRVRVPLTMRPGRYYLRGCVRVAIQTGNRRASCRFARRQLTVLGRSALPGPAAPNMPNPPTRPAEPQPRYRILAFVETTAAYEGAASAAVEALRAAGRRRNFGVDVAEESSAFSDANLQRYRAVVFVNNAGDLLTDAQQSAFERYFRDGGGFLGLHAAIESEPGWQFMTDLLGTRASGAAASAQNAIIKVADRGHEAGKNVPEYWRHGADRYFNYAQNVRGVSHVIATLDEGTYSGGTMGHDHPISWCKDYQGGRSFYTGAGESAASYQDDEFRDHLGGAVEWAAGQADPVYSDCGATVLANFQQTKLSAPPNINEPIGFDRLPDGRVIQTVRDGRVRMHDPRTNTSTVIADLRSNTYTHSEDGMYGPAVDNDFATNKWVYLFYAPLNMDPPYPAQTPPGNAPTTPSADPSVWDAWRGYFQLSRFKFVEATATESAHLDLATEQKILKVEMNRGACCHVAGDIDFDKHNNLWLVTGDDTPSGAGNSGGFGPFNDEKTDETQTVRVNNASGGTFTLTFDGQTTGAIPYNASAATVQSALNDLSNVNPGDAVVNCGANPCPDTQTVNAATMTVVFDGQYAQRDVPQMAADASGLTTGGTTPPTVAIATTQQADLFQPPWFDARRSALNTNDLRGKVLRIRVSADGTYSVPPGNLFPESQDVDNRTRPEIYAMGFRNPFRIQVDENDVAYVTDYSPDSSTPGGLRGPAGTGRVEIVRRPANYGWPVCYKTDLPYFRWNFNTSRTRGTTFECGRPDQGPPNESRWNTGRTQTPPITNPDVWYSFQDATWGTPCLDSYDEATTEPCPWLFPEFGTGGVGPHGAAKYAFDPRNPNPTKFPPYYDKAVFFGEFTRDYLREIRLDSENRVFKINNLLSCGAVGSRAVPFECDNPMDLQFGPDGHFYLLTYGDGFFAANPDAGMYKWEYVKGTRAPLAVLGANPTSGQAPLRVQFSSEGSRDPDPGDSIEFAWDFDNNGTTDSIDPNPVHTYTANGVYTARLTVTDSTGKTDSKTTTITVGNTAPTVTINSPIDGDFIEFGQNVPYSVTVADPEDGSTVDCNRVQVTFVLVHDTHGHGEATATGCSGVLPTDPSFATHGGYLAGGISVSYTDNGANGQPALTTQTQHIVQLKRQEVEFALDQEGTGTANTADAGGGQHRNSLDPGDWIALNNRFYFGNMNQEIVFRFANNAAAGSTRGLVEVHLDSVTGPVAATCTLAATGSNNTFTSQTCPFTTPVTGSRRIFLVFRQATGGPASNFGNLNWVGFNGPGHGVNP